MRQFYGADPAPSDDYGRIVNDRHFDRLSRLLDDEGARRSVFGGDRDRPERYSRPHGGAGSGADARR